MKSLHKNRYREILRSPGRFLAILGIIVLGSGFFVGLRVSQQAMINTADQYLSEQNFFDFSISTTLGLTDEDVEAFADADGVMSAEGAVSIDALISTDGGEDSVVTFHAMPQSINLPKVTQGRLPTNAHECLVDGQSGLQIGEVLTLSDSNDEDTRTMFSSTEFTVVGTATSPLYLNYERGNTSLGSGSISAFVYIQPEAFDVDYYTTVYLRMEGMPSAYSEEYDEAIDQKESSIKRLAEERAKIRYQDIVQEAEDALADGEAEYEDGLKEYQTERADAEQELEDAWAELEDARVQIEDGKAELAEGWKELESQTADGEAELSQAEAELEQAYVELRDGEIEYESGRQKYEDGYSAYQDGVAAYEDQYATYQDGLSQYQEGVDQYQAGLDQYNNSKSQLEETGGQLSAAYDQLNTQQGQLDTLLNTLAANITDPSTQTPLYADGSALLSALRNGDQMAITATDQVLEVVSRIPEYQDVVPKNATELLAMADALEEGWNQCYTGVEQYQEGIRQLEEANKQLTESKKVLDQTKAQLDEAKSQLDAGWNTLEDTRATLEDSAAQLADARKELDDGWTAYDAGVQEVEDGWAELHDSVAEAKEELERAEAELEDAQTQYEEGLKEYQDGKAEAEEEFAKAEKELAEAKQELEDARAEIQEIQYPSTYVLGRWSNVGYACFESDTAIVKSISSVFPIFFFLVAALVCITTITRMVDEQRSQLGVLMALGYGKLAIMNKFFFYSGSATVLGCVIGILFGSWIIPRVIWAAYAIMYSFSDHILYCFGTSISVTVFVAYLAAMLLVTWLACRKEMRDTPANIIRPKAPKAGKRILFERIPFLWNHLSFMWKVTLRNLFRYKQRVLMMILGIGGCTALMITGFGVRDSIQHIVDFQYSEITYYDLAVTFDEAPDEKEQTAFATEVADFTQGVLFARQSSVTAIADKTEKTAYLTVVDDTEDIGQFINFHTGEQPLDYPGQDEALINAGLAEALGVGVGDQISIRSDDEPSMQLTVSGVFDNYIDNYIYIGADTYEEQGEKTVEINTAFILEPEDSDDNALAARLLGMDNVLNVSVSSVVRDRIDSMMGSLIYIVLLTIVCAAALAFIVIYNLTNINITERFREIATVKVLGFYQWESAIYVLRENIILTILGALVGIPMGVWLNSFIIEQIKVDMISLTPRITLVSFGSALLLTFVFSALVDFLMYFRLNKINTAEALKAAE